MSDTTSDTASETIAVYSDYVCPFCYLGKASLDRYRDGADDPPAVEWRPFDLRGHKRRPDGSIDDDADDGKDDAYFERVRENVEQLRERYDVEMLPFDDIPDGVDSWNAQLVALYARERVDAGAFRDLDDALFEALWVDGRDVGDPDVLRDVLESVGFDPEHVDEALADDSVERDLRARFEDAREVGVTGVPTFVYDGYAARGAVPPEHLERLVEGD